MSEPKKTLRERLDEWAAYWKPQTGRHRHGVCACYRRAIEVLDGDTQRIAKWPEQFHLDAVKVQEALGRASSAVSSLVERTNRDGFMIVMYGSDKPSAASVAAAEKKKVTRPRRARRRTALRGEQGVE